MQHARRPPVMVAACRPVLDAVAAGLEADQAHAVVGDERVEHADRVGAAADAGAGPRRAAGRRARASAARASTPMTRWKSRTIAGNGCGPATVPKQVVRGLDVGHPVAQGLVDRVLEGAASRSSPARPRRRAAASGRR